MNENGKSGFGLFIENARKSLGMTQVEAANRIGLSSAAYGHYEKMIEAPNYKGINKIAIALDVPRDYLYHYVEYGDIDAKYVVGKTPERETQENASYRFGERLLAILRSQGKKQTDLAEFLDLKKATVAQYRRMKYPPEHKIDIIAEKLGVSVKDFLPYIAPLEEIVDLQWIRSGNAEKMEAAVTSAVLDAENDSISEKVRIKGIRQNERIAVITITSAKAEILDKDVEKAVNMLKAFFQDD